MTVEEKQRRIVEKKLQFIRFKSLKSQILNSILANENEGNGTPDMVYAYYMNMLRCVQFDFSIKLRYRKCR